MIHPWREREEKALEGEPEAIRLYTCSSRWPLLLTGEFLWQLCTLPPPNVNRLSSSTGSVAPFESRPSGSVDPLLSTRFYPVPSVGPFVWPSALEFFVLFSLLALFFFSVIFASLLRCFAWRVLWEWIPKFRLFSFRGKNIPETRRHEPLLKRKTFSLIIVNFAAEELHRSFSTNFCQSLDICVIFKTKKNSTLHWTWIKSVWSNGDRVDHDRLGEDQVQSQIAQRSHESHQEA